MLTSIECLATATIEGQGDLRGEDLVSTGEVENPKSGWPGTKKKKEGKKVGADVDANFLYNDSVSSSYVCWSQRWVYEDVKLQREDQRNDRKVNIA